MTTTWQEHRKKRSYPALEEEIAADVAVVGGGMAGVLTAYRLAHQGLKVALLEKGGLADGATSATTAFITKVVDTELSELAEIFDPRTAKAVWESGQEAVGEFERIVRAEGIECEFARCSDFIFAAGAKEFKQLREEYATCRRLKAGVMLREDGAALNFPNAGYLEVPGQAKFHPTKFLYALAEKAAARGALIFEHTEVIAVESEGPVTVRTKGGSVVAKDAVFATYKPLTGAKTHLKKAMYRSYVLEVEVPQGLFPEGIYEDMENPYHYFRIDPAAARGDYDRMIVGGEDHKDIFGNPPAAGLGKESFKALGAFLARIMGGHRYWIVKKWAGPILEPTDGLALIGKIAPHCYVATGFSGNGMTYSMISSMLIADLIKGKKNPWAKVYDPTRSILVP
ncbi:FAD-binding oxidoreductase, partial [Candidatus Parcubacteria bacterium]|nr:FAD-binding oxidoreductase [Candidatus Parcubacteria bacterium]